jgi:hypothetical protein
MLAMAQDRRRSAYSRKPGFTETRLRPLARRRDSTARPLLVFMRERKPCVFERRRRLGWNVRFGIEKWRSSLAKSYSGQTKSIPARATGWQLGDSRRRVLDNVLPWEDKQPRELLRYTLTAT